MLSDVEEISEPIASTSYLPPIQSITTTTINSPNKTTLIERVLSPNKFNSLNKSNKSLTNGNSSNNNNSSLGGTRLLWRGSLILENKKVLNGLAMVAHLFTVPTVSPLQTIPQQPSPFDDPFSNSNSNSSFSSAADLCLGLEMMRGGNIKVLGEIKVKFKGKENQSTLVEQEEEESLIEVETPSDVRVYIDKRCPETVDWFESIYCKNKLNKIGIKLDVGGEEVIIFPSYPDPDIDIDSTLTSRPTLTLLLGRRAHLKIRKPRPDDPMPRENLFANILRRTNSMPVLDFQPKRAPLSRSTSTKSHLLPSHLAGNAEQQQSTLKSKTKVSRRNSKSQSLVNLLNGEKEKDSTTTTSGKPLSKSSSRDKVSTTTTASNSSSIKKPRAPLSRSGSTRDLFSTSTNNHHNNHFPPQAQIQPPPRQSLKRSRTVSDLLLSNNSKRTRNFITDDEEMFSNNSNSDEEQEDRILGGSKKVTKRNYGGRIRDDEEDDVEDEEEEEGRFVPGSPTPSIATTFGGEDDDFESETTSSKLFTSLGGVRNRGSSIEPRTGGGKGGGRSKMQRSYSVPVGVVSMREESVVPIGGEAIEVRNRATVRKIVLARLTLAGVSRDDERFKDIFSITSKGVQFALRTNYKSQLINKELATNFTDAHLSMYLGGHATTTTSPISFDIKSTVKQEEDGGGEGEEAISRLKERKRDKIVLEEKDLPPSPKSVEE